MLSAFLKIISVRLFAGGIIDWLDYAAAVKKNNNKNLSYMRFSLHIIAYGAGFYIKKNI